MEARTQYQTLDAKEVIDGRHPPVIFPIPFFSKTVKVDDPSGIRVISESKPFPMVSEKAFLWFEPLTVVEE